MVTVTSPPLPEHSRRRPLPSTRGLGTLPTGSTAHFPSSRPGSSVVNSYALSSTTSAPRVAPRDPRFSQSVFSRDTRITTSRLGDVEDGDSSDTISDDDETWRQRSARAHRRLQERPLASLDDSGSDQGINSPARNVSWQSPTPGARITGPLSANPAGSVFGDVGNDTLLSQRRFSTRSSPARAMNGLSMLSPLPRHTESRERFDHTARYNSGIKSAGMCPPAPGYFSPSSQNPTHFQQSGSLRSPALSASARALRRTRYNYRQRHHESPRQDGSAVELEPIASSGDTTETDEECASMAFSPIPRRRLPKPSIEPDMLPRIDTIKTPDHPRHQCLLSPPSAPLTSVDLGTQPSHGTKNEASNAHRLSISRIRNRRPDPLVFNHSPHTSIPVAGNTFETVLATPEPLGTKAVPVTEPINRRRRIPKLKVSPFDNWNNTARHKAKFDSDQRRHSDSDGSESGHNTLGHRLINRTVDTPDQPHTVRAWEPSTPGYRFERTGYESGDTTETDEEIQAYAHQVRAVHSSVKPSRRIRRELAQIRDGGEYPRPLQLTHPCGRPALSSTTTSTSGLGHHPFAASSATAFPPIVSSVRSRVASPSVSQHPESPQGPSTTRSSRLPDHTQEFIEKRKRALTAPSYLALLPHLRSGSSLTDPSAHAMFPTFEKSDFSKPASRTRPSADDLGAAQALASLSPQSSKVYSAVRPAPSRSSRRCQRVGPSTLLKGADHYHQCASEGMSFGRTKPQPPRKAFDPNNSSDTASDTNDTDSAPADPSIRSAIRSRKRRRRSSTYTSGVSQEHQRRQPTFTPLPALPQVPSPARSVSQLQAESEFPVLIPQDHTPNSTNTGSTTPYL